MSFSPLLTININTVLICIASCQNYGQSLYPCALPQASGLKRHVLYNTGSRESPVFLVDLLFLCACQPFFLSMATHKSGEPDAGLDMAAKRSQQK